MTLATPALNFDAGQALDLPDRLTLLFAVSGCAARGPVHPKDARRVASSRHCLGTWLRACGVHDHLIEDAELLLTELVTNAVEHGSVGDVEIRVISSRDSVMLNVRDGSKAVPRLQAPDTDAEGGRGLLIVDAITRDRGGDWGVSRDNTTTWCTISSRTEETRARSQPAP
ncbi:ATP-binding protein [Streptomyces sp. NPDC026672]|uniref:ATP-binding protein n=1 Tax=unclassified Streptomyces TaxID=2593676 RepID=UPI0033EA1F7F